MSSPDYNSNLDCKHEMHLCHCCLAGDRKPECLYRDIIGIRHRNIIL